MGIIGTFCTGLLALGLSLWVFWDSNSSFNQTRQQVVLSRMAEFAAEIPRHIETHPECAKYFNKMFRDEHVTDKALLDEFHSLPINRQIPFWIGCEKIADYIQFAFTQRTYLDREDWNSWWSYFCDLYDENPILREFLAKKSTWYSYETAITKARRESFER